MNPSLFFLVLRARMGLFALVVGATLAATLAVSLVLPRTYQATAAVVVDRRDPQSMNTAMNVYASPAERAAYMQTQLDILKSPKVGRKVVDALGITQQPAIQKAFNTSSTGKASIEDWAAERLQRGMEVETSQSNVIRISYDADDPVQAARLANAFAQAYLDTSLELHVDPTRQAAAWFDEQLKSLRTDLEDAQQRLTDYQREHGIVSTDERLDDEYSRLADLSAQLSRVRDQNTETAARAALVQQAMRSGRSLADIPEVRSDPGIQALKAKLQQGETELQVLAARYGENYPEYSRRQTEVRSSRAALNAEMARVAAATADRVVEGQTREAEIEAALAAQRARVLNLKDSRDGLSVLVRNVNTAQQAYDTAMQRFVENRVESRASQADAALLNPAVVPQRQHSPDIPLNLALATLVGLMLATGIVMLREMTDRRVHTAWEVAEIARAPVLGELIAWSPPNRLSLPSPSGRMESP